MKTIIGIDVCSQYLQVCLLKNETSEKVETKFSNSSTGIRKFVAWAEKFAPCKVVMEATGGYEKALVNQLLKPELVAQSTALLYNDSTLYHYRKRSKQ